MCCWDRQIVYSVWTCLNLFKSKPILHGETIDCYDRNFDKTFSDFDSIFRFGSDMLELWSERSHAASSKSVSEISLNVIQSKKAKLKHIGQAVRNDKDIVLSAVKQNENVLLKMIGKRYIICHIV